MSKSDVTFFFFCKYHPLVLSLSLFFLTWHIHLLCGKKKKKSREKPTRQSVPVFGAFCEALLMRVGWWEGRGILSRLKGWKDIFVTECKTQRRRRENGGIREHCFISWECKQKGREIIKVYFCKTEPVNIFKSWNVEVTYWVGMGSLLYVLYMRFIILWFYLYFVFVFVKPSDCFWLNEHMRMRLTAKGIFGVQDILPEMNYK